MKTTPVGLQQCLETPTETDMQEHVYQKPVRVINEQDLIETWSATSRASLIKRLISGEIVLMRISNPKSNAEHLLWYFSVPVVTFKAYVTAVMNKLTYISFHKVGWEQLSGEVGNFDTVLLRIYFSICLPKIIVIQCGLTKLLQKQKKCNFLPCSVVIIIFKVFFACHCWEL